MYLVAGACYEMLEMGESVDMNLVEDGVGCDVKQEAVISCSLCGQIFRLPSELCAHAMEAPTTLVEETSLGLDVRDTHKKIKVE